MSDWQVTLRDDGASLQTYLYVFREVDGKIECAHIGENGQIRLTQGKRFEPLKPFLILSDMMARELFKGLSGALDKAGFKPPSTEKAEGLLEATKYHLEDMRKLLKLSRAERQQKTGEGR